MQKVIFQLLMIPLFILFGFSISAQILNSIQTENIGAGGAEPRSGWGLYTKDDIRLEDKNTVSIDFYGSTTNSSGGIKKVAKIEYDDPNGGNAFTNDDFQIVNLASTAGDIEFYTLRDNNGGVNSMKFEGGNNPNAIALQILHSNTITLRLRGNGNMTIAGSLTENSDLRLKKDINQLTSVLPKLNQISAYTYHWKDESRGDRPQIGLLAQEVEAQYPELVSADEEGTLSVSYTKLVPVLLEAIKEQQTQIGTLQSAMSNRDSEIEKIKQQIGLKK